jgi:nitrite reductase/ring-hydroxylating ferredoxin subunit
VADGRRLERDNASNSRSPSSTAGAARRAPSVRPPQAGRGAHDPRGEVEIVAKHVVATVDEIPPGGRKIVAVAGRSIGVFNLGGEFFALRNSCPHQGGELCRGALSGAVTSRGPGDYAYDRPGEIVRCPWHGWEFDVRTGRSWCDPARLRVRRYDVTIEAGGETTPDDSEERVPGPYVAETFPVTVDHQWVVVDVPG